MGWRVISAAVAIGLAIGAFSPASASGNGLIEKLTPENVSETLNALGIPYALETDPRGFPMIAVNPKPFPVQQFNIMFFSCDTVAVECEDITLWSWYDVEKVSPQTINIWNDPFQGARRWSTGYLDQENDPALIMNINATGGIGERALQILVNTYIEDIFAFHKALETRISDAGDVQPAEVSGRALVDSDLLKMTNLLKDHGGLSYAKVKQSVKKGN